jgi:hypothetical protein
VLDTLRDPSHVESERLMEVIEGMGFENTFRGVVGPDGWVRSDQMGYQQSGGLGRDLKRAGVGCVIMGDVKDEVSGFPALSPHGHVVCVTECQSSRQMLGGCECS